MNIEDRPNYIEKQFPSILEVRNETYRKVLREGKRATRERHVKKLLAIMSRFFVRH